MPFRHPDRTHDLGTRIDMEVRERLEEAVDFVCLEALVAARRQRGLPPPAADNAADRRDYLANVSGFLALLQRELTADLTADQRDRLRAAAAGSSDQAHMVTSQVALARLLPDYWQRFDAARTRYLGGAASDRDAATAAVDESGREGRGLLARLFGRS